MAENNESNLMTVNSAITAGVIAIIRFLSERLEIREKCKIVIEYDPDKEINFIKIEE